MLGEPKLTMVNSSNLWGLLRLNITNIEFQNLQILQNLQVYFFWPPKKKKSKKRFLFLYFDSGSDSGSRTRSKFVLKGVPILVLTQFWF